MRTRQRRGCRCRILREGEREREAAAAWCWMLQKKKKKQRGLGRIARCLRGFASDKRRLGGDSYLELPGRGAAAAGQAKQRYQLVLVPGSAPATDATWRQVAVTWSDGQGRAAGGSATTATGVDAKYRLPVGGRRRYQRYLLYPDLEIDDWCIFFSVWYLDRHSVSLLGTDILPCAKSRYTPVCALPHRHAQSPRSRPNPGWMHLAYIRSE